MNRRSILGLFGLAPIAAPAAVRAALAEPARGGILRSTGGANLILSGEYIVDGSRLACGSITADRIPAGSILAEKLGPAATRDFKLSPHANAADRLVGALSFGA